MRATTIKGITRPSLDDVDSTNMVYIYMLILDLFSHYPEPMWT